MAYEVTIGIPVYNVEKHIRLTMDSALAQTFESIEFLVCDDCGTDSSINIIREYQEKHPRGKDIRIVRQPQNMGIGAARNRMIEEAQGRYFYSLDADDSITPNAIELLYKTAQEHQAEIVYGSYERIFTEGERVVKTIQYPYPNKVFIQPDEYANYVYNIGIQVMNWNYLIDINILRRNHLQVTPVGHGYGEDFTFTVDLPTYITRAVLLSDITYMYYIREVYKSKRHKTMSRQQMDISIEAIDKKKHRIELKDKPYYAKRCATLLMYSYSFACQIIARRGEANPPYTNKEIRHIMWQPMSLKQILFSKQSLLQNLAAWAINRLPASLSVSIIRMYLLVKLNK